MRYFRALAIGVAIWMLPGRALFGASAGPARFEKASQAVGPHLYSSGKGKIASGYLDEKKFILVYFSASWCAPCRAFTPYLVEFYNEHAADKGFEVVLVGRDLTDRDMRAYMSDFDMPWAAVPFGNDRARRQLAAWYAGPGGLPNLVLLDPKGRVLASSYEGEGYVGPRHALHVLRDLWGE